MMILSLISVMAMTSFAQSDLRQDLPGDLPEQEQNLAAYARSQGVCYVSDFLPCKLGLKREAQVKATKKARKHCEDQQMKADILVSDSACNPEFPNQPDDMNLPTQVVCNAETIYTCKALE